MGTDIQLEHLSALIQNYCNTNLWSNTKPLYAQDMSKIHDSVLNEPHKETTLFYHLEKYLHVAASNENRHSVSSKNNRLLNIVKILESPLTNEEEDAVRLCAYEVLHRSINLYFPKGYLPNDMQFAHILPSLHGILNFLIDRLDDVPCQEKVVECLYTLLVLKDCVIQLDGEEDNQKENHLCGCYSTSLPLPVLLEMQEGNTAPRKSMNVIEKVTCYPHAIFMRQYRWLSVKDVAFFLNAVCEKTQVEYLRSSHRRQIYDLFSKYFLTQYEINFLTLSSQHSLVYFQELYAYGEQIISFLISNNFVSNFLRCFDNERDPRNVLSFLQICRSLIYFTQKEQYSHLPNREDLFDAVSCFFPLSYENSDCHGNSISLPGDAHVDVKYCHEFVPISLEKYKEVDSREIKICLHQIIAKELFDDLSVPFLLDKIESPLPSVQIDVFDVLSTIFQKELVQQSPVESNLIVRENAGTVWKKISGAVRMVLQSCEKYYQVFSEAIFHSQHLMQEIIIHGRSPGVCATASLSTELVEAWIHLSNTLNGKQKENNSKNAKERDYYCHKLLEFLECFRSWVSVLDVRCGCETVSHVIFDDVVHELLQSTQKSQHDRLLYSVHSRNSNILVNASLFLVNGCNYALQNYVITKISPLIKSRLNEIDHARKRLFTSHLFDSMDSEAAETIQNDSQTALLVIIALLQMIDKRISKDIIRLKPDCLNDEIHFLENVMEIYRVFEYCSGVCLSENDNIKEQQAALECITSMGLLYFNILSHLDITQEKHIQKFIRRANLIVQFFADLHLRSESASGVQYLIPIIRLTAISRVARGKVFEIVFPRWKSAFNGIQCSESGLVDPKNILKGIEIIASQITNEASESELSMFIEIIDFLFENSDRFLKATTCILSMLIEKIPPKFSNKIDISVSLGTFFLKVRDRSENGEIEEYFSSRKYMAYETLFWMVRLSLKKGLCAPAALRVIMEPGNNGSYKEFMYLMKVVSVSIELSEGRDPVVGQKILCCFDSVCRDVCSAELCKYLALVATENHGSGFWIMELYKEFFDRLKSAVLLFGSTINIIHVMELEQKIQVIASVSLYLIKLMFYSTGNDDVENLLDQFFALFSGHEKVMKCVWFIISSSHNESHLRAYTEIFGEDRSWKVAISDRGIKILCHWITENYIFSLTEVKHVLAFLLHLSNIRTKELRTIQSTNADAFFPFLSTSMSLFIPNYENYREQILSIQCVCITLLGYVASIPQVETVLAILRVSLAPLKDENYFESDAIILASCLDILCVLYTKSKKELLTDATILPHDISNLLPKVFFTTHLYAIRDCVLQMTKKALRHPKRYVRQRAQKCRHLYSIIY